MHKSRLQGEVGCQLDPGKATGNTPLASGRDRIANPPSPCMRGIVMFPRCFQAQEFPVVGKLSGQHACSDMSEIAEQPRIDQSADVVATVVVFQVDVVIQKRAGVGAGALKCPVGGRRNAGGMEACRGTGDQHRLSLFVNGIGQTLDRAEIVELMPLVRHLRNLRHPDAEAGERHRRQHDLVVVSQRGEDGRRLCAVYLDGQKSNLILICKRGVWSGYQEQRGKYAPNRAFHCALSNRAS